MNWWTIIGCAVVIVVVILFLLLALRFIGQVQCLVLYGNGMKEERDRPRIDHTDLGVKS